MILSFEASAFIHVKKPQKPNQTKNVLNKTYSIVTEHLTVQIVFFKKGVLNSVSLLPNLVFRPSLKCFFSASSETRNILNSMLYKRGYVVEGFEKPKNKQTKKLNTQC